jgi:hypothetical protein
MFSNKSPRSLFPQSQILICIAIPPELDNNLRRHLRYLETETLRARIIYSTYLHSIGQTIFAPNISNRPPDSARTCPRGRSLKMQTTIAASTTLN